MNGEVEGNAEEAMEAVADDGQPEHEPKVAQAPGRSAGKVKQMVDSFNQDEFNQDDNGQMSQPITKESPL